MILPTNLYKFTIQFTPDWTSLNDVTIRQNSVTFPQEISLTFIVEYKVPVRYQGTTKKTHK